MAGQPEAGDVGGGLGAQLGRHLGGGGVGALHLGQRGEEPGAAQRGLHVGVEQHAGAQRLAQHQRPAGAQAVEAAQRLVLAGQPLDLEAH